MVRWAVLVFLFVSVGCGSTDKLPDGGLGDAPQKGDFSKATCGNGVLESGESCDTAIPAGQTGACPTSCDDGEVCTSDQLLGSGCQATCQFTTLGCKSAASDGCCPAGCDAQSDPDCDDACGNGVIDPGELCDTAIAAGQAGACPTSASCSDGQACTLDTLTAGGTCQARCVTAPITACGGAVTDGCCPEGCTANEDADCSASCGNGSLEGTESCDTQIPAGQPGSCPTLADCDDQIACTQDSLVGAGCSTSCSNTSITSCSTAASDGCCPVGCDASTDVDCTANCGNGVVEPGETCDTQIAIGQAGFCPQSCDDGVACTVDTLVGGGCTAACSNAPITGCSGSTSDGCCPTGCTSATDTDCPASCGNGVVDGGETCDTAIAAGQTGACPTSADCDDKVACTIDKLVGSGCTVACSHASISSCGGAAGGKDGCCPAGCNATTDADCSASCGNGVVEPGETCDTTIPAGQTGACPQSCDDGVACTIDKLVGSGCNTACSYAPISACNAKLKDGCCPAGCNATTDLDCSATCGNGVVEPGETCDTKIPAGQTGACPTSASCDDKIACTLDQLVGSGCSAACAHTPVTTCSAKLKDGCCPSGCNAVSDADCSASCGNGVVEPGETCDTKIPAGQAGACPSSCDDGKPCTFDQLVGSACTAACSWTPIQSCNAKQKDGCCPTGCNASNDLDCPAVCGNGVLELGEKCDTKIPVGAFGACPTSCSDGNPCTTDSLTGQGCQAECMYAPVTTCSLTKLDKCCPSNCNANTDGDCNPVCGNGVVEPPEYCDTKIPVGQKGACPSSCNDNNACTRDTLLGKTCDLHCDYAPITACSVFAKDGCCPKGCTSKTDADCP